MGQVLDNLANVQPLDFNTSVINSSDLVVSVIDNANTTTNDLWFIVTILAFWLFLMWLIHDKNKGFVYDIPRTILISSGWCLLISIALAISTIINTIIPIIWFTFLVFLGFFTTMARKQKNL